LFYSPEKRRNVLYLRGAHAVVVVLADEDDGQVPELSEVVGLRHLALVGSTVAVQREVHAAVALVLVGKGDAGPQRNLNKKSGTIHFKKEANTFSQRTCTGYDWLQEIRDDCFQEGKH
jgi:hypothetical protein